MNTRGILIIYGTTYGQTGKIARRIAERLHQSGHEVTLLCGGGDELPLRLALDEFDCVVIGASVLIGRHPRYIERFLRDHRAELERVPSAFFSVSNAAASADPTAREEAENLATEMLTKVGWTPAITAIFGGALAYTQYGAVTRWVMKSISRGSGGPTDTSRDHELTDWSAVDRFADELARLVPQHAPVVAQAS